MQLLIMCLSPRVDANPAAAHCHVSHVGGASRGRVSSCESCEPGHLVVGGNRGQLDVEGFVLTHSIPAGSMPKPAHDTGRSRLHPMLELEAHWM